MSRFFARLCQRVFAVCLCWHSLALAGPGSGGPELPLDDRWPRVVVAVGEPLDLRLAELEGQIPPLRWRGGPPGLRVGASGVVDYTPRPEHLGRWRVTVWEAGDGRLVPPSGLEVVVVPPGPPEEVGERAFAGKAVKRGYYDLAAFAGYGWIVGVGGAGGISDARHSWSRPRDRVLAAGSPALSLSAHGGSISGLWWFIGVDSAPMSRSLQNDVLRSHLVGTFMGLGAGRRAWFAGGYFALGFVRGLGARLLWLPPRDQGRSRRGLDLRATWMPSPTPAGEVMVLYSFDPLRLRRRTPKATY